MSTTEEAAILAGMIQRITALERAASRREWEPGDIKQTVATVAPAGWLFFGQSILNADTLYPNLWAVVPASWKSGTSLTLPVLTDRVLREGVTVGDLAGADSHTLTVANLPSHDHSIDHGHADTIAVSSSDGTHTHNLTGGIVSSGAHSHTASGSTTLSLPNPPAGVGTASGDVAKVASGGYSRIARTGTATTTVTVNTTNSAHTHTDDFAVGSTGSGHNHAVTGGVTNHTGNSGPTGSGAAVDHTPAHMTVRTMIKV